MSERNDVFEEMMGSFGESYVGAIYTTKVKDASGQGSKTFDPQRVKNKDTDKMAACYRYTTTDIHLSAETLEEAVSKGNYQKYERFTNSLYDCCGDNLMRSDS